MVYFNIFNDKEVDIFEKGPNRVINGVSVPNTTLKHLCSVNVDIQPYSSSEAKMDYGFDVITTHRIFMDVIKLEIGKHLVKYNGNKYELKQQVVWDSYMELIVEMV